MRNSNKKGFTIVELVIVIAVIAILAAVLIPTFSGIIKKAQQSADQQAVRQMNTFLTTEGVTGEVDLVKALETLDEAGYKAESLTPVTKNHVFYWYKTHNIVVLVNTVDNSLVYPTDEKYATTFETEISTPDGIFYNLENSAIYQEAVVSGVDALKASIEAGNGTIVLEDDINLGTSGLVIDADGEITIDLNGKKIEIEAKADLSYEAISVAEGTNLTLVGGEIIGRGVNALAGSNLTIKGTKIVACDATVRTGAVNAEAGSTVTIESGDFCVSGEGVNHYRNENGIIIGYTGSSAVTADGGEVIIKGGNFYNEVERSQYLVRVVNNGKVIINGGTFTSYTGMIGIGAGTATVNNGDFKWIHNEGDSQWLVFLGGATCAATINGGTWEVEGNNPQKNWICNDYGGTFEYFDDFVGADKISE